MLLASSDFVITELTILAASTYLISYSITPLWYFKAVERLSFATFIESISIVVGIGIVIIKPGLFVTIESVLLVQAGIKLVGVGLLYWQTNLTGNITENWYITDVYRNSFGTFFYRLISSIYVAGFPILLATFISPKNFGIFIVAERLFRAGQGVMHPITQVLYVKSLQVTAGSIEHLRRVKQSLLVLIVVSSLGMIMTLLLSKPLIEYFYAVHLADAYRVLNYLALLFPISVMSSVLSLQYFVPLGKEKTISIFSIVGALSCVLTVLVVSRYDEEYSFFALIVAEVTVLSCLIYTFLRRINKTK
jgi:O-antigen/teichoic acid export membrane protein